MYVHEPRPGATVDGDGSAATVVLVHGSMDRAAGLLRVARVIRSGPCWLYDRRGYGRSARTRARCFEDHLADLLAVLDLTGDRPVVLGHSYGGVLALAAAAGHPDAVSAIVAYEAPRGWETWWPPPPPPGVDAEAYAEAFVRRVVGERWEAMSPAVRAQRRREGAPMVDELRWQGERRYDGSGITVPVIVGVGGLSRPTVHKAAMLLARECPRGELAVIEGAEHMAPVTHPAALATLVDRARAARG